MDTEWGQHDSSKGIDVIVGINGENRLTTVRLDTHKNTHVIMTGMIGCGKTSYIHSLINGVIMQYNPHNVQIWLIGYDAIEYSSYLNNIPKHIKYIGLGTTDTHICSFIDKLYEQLNVRLNIIGSYGSYELYRNSNTANFLPRILIIVDEFHSVGRCLENSSEYRYKFENVIRMGHAVGMTFFLSDQSYIRLLGLSEASRYYLNCRMSMLQRRSEEYQQIFDLSDVNCDIIPKQGLFEIIIRRNNIELVTSGDDMEFYYERNMCLYTSKRVQEHILEKSKIYYGASDDCRIEV